MVLKAEFYGVRGFRELMGSLAVVAEEVRLQFDCGGLSVLEMDPSHVAMVGLELPCGAFDRYSCGADTGDPLVVSVNVGELVKMLKRGKKDEALILEYESGADFLGVTLRGSVIRVKRVPVLEELGVEVPRPKILFKASARVLSKAIHRLVLPDLGDVSEHCWVSMVPGADYGGVGKSSAAELVFFATGDMGSCRVVYDQYHDHVLELKVEEASKATFEIHWLAQFFRGFAPLSEVVGLSLSEDLPIRIEAELPQGSLVYHLAPCVGI